MTIVVLLIIFIVLLALRVPLVIALSVFALSYIVLTGVTQPIAFVINSFQSMDRFPLLAVPLFILAGQVMSKAGIAQRLLDVMDEMFGRMHGGYALATIAGSVLFGGMSGSAPATVAVLGGIMIPAMIRQGYDRGFAAGVAACAGVLAVIIPPSNPMIIYALVTGTSIKELFLAGFGPALLLALSMAIPAYLVSASKGWGGKGERGTINGFLAKLWRAKWALFTPCIILGGIYSGLFTPTESAAVACSYALIIGLFVHKDFGMRDIPLILRDAALPICSVMIIVTASAALGAILVLEQAPERITELIGGFSNSPAVLILSINLLLLVVGTIMETFGAIIVLSPFLLPIVEEIGMGPTQFGLLMIVNLGIGFVTPPLGANLFIANQIGKTTIHKVFRGALPMLAGMIIALLLIAWFPQISYFFPNLFS